MIMRIFQPFVTSNLIAFISEENVMVKFGLQGRLMIEKLIRVNETCSNYPTATKHYIYLTYGRLFCSKSQLHMYVRCLLMFNP